MIEARVPPHDMDAEAAVLSAVMLDPSAHDKVADIAPPEKYYAGCHQLIFQACVELTAEGKPTDIVTVGNWLKNRDRIAQIGGMAYLTELLNAAPAVSNVAAYAKIIAEKYAVRQLIATCQRIAAEGYLDYGNARTFLDAAEAEVHRASQTLVTNRADTFGTMHAAMKAAFEDIAKCKGGGGVTGTPTGLTKLDELITGLHGGELYVIAGRPGTGKSALAFQIGAHVASLGMGALGCTLEMPSKQIALRLACADANVSSSLTRSGGLRPEHWPRLTAAAKKVAPLPMWLDEKASASIANIRSSVRRTVRECDQRKIKLGVVIVDYMQLAEAMGGDSREQEISAISREMKAIAKDHDVPVLGLSQLNRNCEGRQDKRPMLSDLRESGAIEQDADTVIFLYRDKMYDADSPDGDCAELIVAKQRQGPTSMVKVLFDDATTSFRDLVEDADYGRTWVPPNDYSDRKVGD